MKNENQLNYYRYKMLQNFQKRG